MHRHQQVGSCSAELSVSLPGKDSRLLHARETGITRTILETLCSDLSHNNAW